MADAPRRADAIWEGSLDQGSGGVAFTSSGAAGPCPSPGRRAPSARTARRAPRSSSPPRTPAATAWRSQAASATRDAAEKLEVGATVTFAQIEGGWKVGSSALTVKGTVPGRRRGDVQGGGRGGQGRLPHLGALKGNVELSVEATLA